jgi:hypothetical protein
VVLLDLVAKTLCPDADTGTVGLGVADVDSGVRQVLFGLLGAEPTSLQRLTMGYSTAERIWSR